MLNDMISDFRVFLLKS